MSDRDLRILADELQSELDDAYDSGDMDRIRELESALRRIRAISRDRANV